ncbi:ArsR/SmtB family transcription factor [Litoreibacter roseus]|uniref:Transcriptional regulator n=1 Tax=Litoreibacter roseus TaxID=2601869 RepID=A0A6N6J9W8_9RHOB|nr:metalloregulator ArsR/SmtB family transcription factor [Litoreibacter roseus]GFE63053.1 transcriptional regulator [Litoreibacter roseus]
MIWEEAAQGFAAMGSEQRLKVLRVLIRAGEDGLAVSDLQSRTDIAPTTLAHHLKFLVGSGLVKQERVGRTTLNRADYAALEALSDFILQECCADVARKAANNG